MVNVQLFAEVYKYSPIGLVILDENTDLMDVNEYMFESFALKKKSFQGKKFGNLFGCSVVAGSDKKCGETEACLLCDLRGGVTSVLEQDAKIKDVTVNHAFEVGSVHTIKWFKLSASSIKSDDKKYAIVSFVDITKEKQYEEMLKHELTLDLATGTVNKNALVGILMDLTKYADAGQCVTVGIIDMDNFKDINDTYGHLAGDDVLQSLSEIARQCIRKKDIIGRFGGEEFMFVFPGADIKRASEIVKRIHDALRGKYEGKIQGISFSAGFMELTAQDLRVLTKENIIEIVDGYLYDAKNAGKQCFVSKGLSIKL